MLFHLFSQYVYIIIFNFNYEEKPCFRKTSRAPIIVPIIATPYSETKNTTVNLFLVTKSLLFATDKDLKSDIMGQSNVFQKFP